MSTEARDTTDSGGRRPIVVFALLAGLAGLILLGSNLLVGRLRQPTDLRPVAVAGTTGPTAPAAIATMLAAPTVGPTTIVATTVPGATVTATPTPVLTATALPTLAPPPTVTLPITPDTPPPGATAGRSNVVVVSASPSPQRVAIPERFDPQSPLVPEVVTFYLRYWEVRAQAFETVDAALLPDIMAESALEADQARIGQLRSLGVAVKVQGEHTITIFRLTPDYVVLVDQFADRSIFIDPGSGREVPGVVPAVQKLVFVLRKIDGVWKVVEMEQQ